MTKIGVDDYLTFLSRSRSVSDLSNIRIVVQITLQYEYIPETFCVVLSCVDTQIEMSLSSFKRS
jgi:hypothetical protein